MDFPMILMDLQFPFPETCPFRLLHLRFDLPCFGAMLPNAFGGPRKQTHTWGEKAGEGGTQGCEIGQLAGGFNHYLFPPVPGELIQFD